MYENVRYAYLDKSFWLCPVEILVDSNSGILLEYLHISFDHIGSRLSCIRLRLNDQKIKQTVI